MAIPLIVWHEGMLQGVDSHGRHVKQSTLRMTRLTKKSSCSLTGRTSGARVVMLAFRLCPAIVIKSLDRYTPVQLANSL